MKLAYQQASSKVLQLYALGREMFGGQWKFTETVKRKDFFEERKKEQNQACDIPLEKDILPCISRELTYCFVRHVQNISALQKQKAGAFHPALSDFSKHSLLISETRLLTQVFKEEICSSYGPIRTFEPFSREPISLLSGRAYLNSFLPEQILVVGKAFCVWL